MRRFAVLARKLGVKATHGAGGGKALPRQILYCPLSFAGTLQGNSDKLILLYVEEEFAFKPSAFKP